jgi:hypothetical protein
MFDDIKDTFAKLSIARLQKRIDALQAHQEMLNKFTEQRGLNELEHYRLQLSIAVASIVFFGTMSLVSIGFAVAVELSHYDNFEKLLSALILLILLVILVGIWESNALKTIKFWSAAASINRVDLQRRIDELQRLLAVRMSKRFGGARSHDTAQKIYTSWRTIVRHDREI